LNVTRVGAEIHIHAEARSFLHHQIRNITGTLALIGTSKWEVNDLKKALAAQSRSAGGPTAPPHGLYLAGVDYPDLK
jgi:tRNA pseudouridine38-40 synthase